METELISVIVPVYNVERYLRRCVDSILHQTYRNLEVLLVDDGSTDASGAICRTGRTCNSSPPEKRGTLCSTQHRARTGTGNVSLLCGQ